jgi:hypothetical protein
MARERKRCFKQCYLMAEQQQRKNATAGEAKEQNSRADQSRASHPCHDSHASYGLACVCTLFVSKAGRAEGPSPRGKKESIYMTCGSSQPKGACRDRGEGGNQVYLKQDGPLCSVLSELAAP